MQFLGFTRCKKNAKQNRRCVRGIKRIWASWFVLFCKWHTGTNSLSFFKVISHFPFMFVTAVQELAEATCRECFWLRKMPRMCHAHDHFIVFKLSFMYSIFSGSKNMIIKWCKIWRKGLKLQFLNCLNTRTHVHMMHSAVCSIRMLQAIR